MMWLVMVQAVLSGMILYKYYVGGSNDAETKK